jgi:hypothetical protein
MWKVESPKVGQAMKPLSQRLWFYCQQLSKFFMIWSIPSMIDDDDKLFRRIHGHVGCLKQTMCYMHAWNDSNDQYLKTLRDAKNLKKDDDYFQNGMEDWKCGWVSFHHFLLMMIFWWPRFFILVRVKASCACATFLQCTNNKIWPIVTWTQTPNALN